MSESGDVRAELEVLVYVDGQDKPPVAFLVSDLTWDTARARQVGRAISDGYVTVVLRRTSVSVESLTVVKP